MRDSYEVTVGPEGRMLIPVEVRRAAGLEPGTRAMVSVDGEQVVPIPHDAIKRRLRRIFASVAGSMAEDLIAERRASYDPGNPADGAGSSALSQGRVHSSDWP